MDIEQDRLHNFGRIYSPMDDSIPFERAYQRVKEDPWSLLYDTWNFYESRRLQPHELDPQGARNIYTLEAAIRSRRLFLDSHPVTVVYHGSTLYGFPVKNDMDYFIAIDPNYLNRYVTADTNLLNSLIDNYLFNAGVNPDSNVIENRGIGNSSSQLGDEIKLFTAWDIALFCISIPIYGNDMYQQIHKHYMELLSMDPELLLLTATIQEDVLQYHLGRWGDFR